jgi:hypothetical protein
MGAPATPTATGSTSPALQYQAVTPGTRLGAPCRSLYIGGTGDVVVSSADGTSVTFSAVPAGVILPIVTFMVVSATATNIVALY